MTNHCIAGTGGAWKRFQDPTKQQTPRSPSGNSLQFLNERRALGVDVDVDVGEAATRGTTGTPTGIPTSSGKRDGTGNLDAMMFAKDYVFAIFTRQKNVRCSTIHIGKLGCSIATSKPPFDVDHRIAYTMINPDEIITKTGVFL